MSVFLSLSRLTRLGGVVLPNSFTHTDGKKIASILESISASHLHIL